MSSDTETVEEEIKECELQIKNLEENIERIRVQQSRKSLAEISKATDIAHYEPKCRNLGTGHYGKIYALHWGIDSQFIMTAAQDGKLIVWTARQNRHLLINLTSKWVMTCALSPSYQLAASGGLDNTVSIFKITPRNSM